MVNCQSFLGRLERTRHSVANWIRDEENGGLSVQIVVMTEGKRTQVFLPMSEFGNGWEGVALVIEGFAIGAERAPKDGGGNGGNEDKGLMTGKRVASPLGRAIGLIGRVEVVQGVAEERWFSLLNRAFVGRVGFRGEKGVSFLAMTDWVRRWWKEFGEMEI